MENNIAPVIVFGFNRVKHLSTVLNALSNNELAKDSDLYIFIDKPLDDDKANREKQREVVAYIDKNLSKLSSDFNSVTLKEANKHKGCKKSIIDGIDEVIHKHGKAIIVEDDILVSRDFLDVMNSMLTFYESDSRVFTVGAYSEPMKTLEHYSKDVYAVYRATSWGWATWADRFDKIEFNLDKSVLNDKEVLKRLKRGGSDLPGLLKNELLGLSDAWDVELAYMHAKLDKITILPTQTRSYNIGFDNSGTHCTDATSEAKKQQQLIEGLAFTPECVDVDNDIAKEFYQIHSGSLLGKIRRNLNAAGIHKAVERFKLIIG